MCLNAKQQACFLSRLGLTGLTSEWNDDAIVLPPTGDFVHPAVG